MQSAKNIEEHDNVQRMRHLMLSDLIDEITMKRSVLGTAGDKVFFTLHSACKNDLCQPDKRKNSLRLSEKYTSVESVLIGEADSEVGLIVSRP